jgi:hypothetical protein
MAWARVDDQFGTHLKSIRLLKRPGGLAAVGLWTLCLAWVHAHDMDHSGHGDGFVPTEIVELYGGDDADTLASLLVLAGLWEAGAPDGWRIHDYRYWQDLEAREAMSAAGKRGAAKRWGRQPGLGQDPLFDAELRATDAIEQAQTVVRGVTTVSAQSARVIAGAAIAVKEAQVTVEQSRHQRNERNNMDSSYPDESGQDGPPYSTQAKPSQAKAKPKDQNITRSAAADAGLFEKFYRAYPRKKEPQAARRAWEKAVRHADAQLIIDGAVRYAKQRDGEDPKLTKYPATWLNRGCWDDEDDPEYERSGEVAPFR